MPEKHTERDEDVVPHEDAEPTLDAGPGGSSEGVLGELMRQVLEERSRMHEAQTRLRELETETRSTTVNGEKQSRFERMHAAALEEYRKARFRALRARRDLIINLNLLPQRSR